MQFAETEKCRVAIVLHNLGFLLKPVKATCASLRFLVNAISCLPPDIVV